jgi:hypothetical protein
MSDSTLQKDNTESMTLTNSNPEVILETIEINEKKRDNNNTYSAGSAESTEATESPSAIKSLSAEEEKQQPQPPNSNENALVCTAENSAPPPPTELATEELSEEDFDWDNLEALTSKRFRQQTLLGEEVKINALNQTVPVAPKGHSSELAGEILDWAESGKKWREIRANRIKWRPQQNIFAIPQDENEEKFNEITEEIEDNAWNQLKISNRIDNITGKVNSVNFHPNSKGAANNSTVPAYASLPADFQRAALDGSRFVKHSRYGFPKPKIVKINLQTGLIDWGSNFLSLKDAYKIEIDRNHNYFTILTGNRMLQLEAENDKERRLWVEGLAQLFSILLPHAKPHRTVEVITLQRLQRADYSQIDEKLLDQWDFSEFLFHLAQGREIIKHGTYGKAKLRVLTLNPANHFLSWGSKASFFPLTSKTKLLPGINSTNFARNLPPQCCFSLLNDKKQLDLQCSSGIEQLIYVQGLNQAIERIKLGEKLSTYVKRFGNQAKLAPLSRGGENSQLSSIAGSVNYAPSVTVGASVGELDDSSSDSEGKSQGNSADCSRNNSELGPIITDAEFFNFLTAAQLGTNFIKHNSSFGKAKSRLFKLDLAQNQLIWDDSSCLALSEISSVEAGKNSKVFEKISFRTAHPSACFSLLFSGRTLDLQCSNEAQRNYWVENLRELLLRARKGKALAKFYQNYKQKMQSQPGSTENSKNRKKNPKETQSADEDAGSKEKSGAYVLSSEITPANENHVSENKDHSAANMALQNCSGVMAITNATQGLISLSHLNNDTNNNNNTLSSAAT